MTEQVSNKSFLGMNISCFVVSRVLFSALLFVFKMLKDGCFDGRSAAVSTQMRFSLEILLAKISSVFERVK